MVLHAAISSMDLLSKIKNKQLCFGGNRQLKIYGTLQCKSGKRLRKENRVFFVSEKQAIEQHYRPCGHCMQVAYQKWKDGFI